MAVLCVGMVCGYGVGMVLGVGMVCGYGVGMVLGVGMVCGYGAGMVLGMVLCVGMVGLYWPVHTLCHIKPIPSPIPWRALDCPPPLHTSTD